MTDEQREFLHIIKKCRRRMNAAQTWEKLAAAMAVGALFGIGFEAAAFILPFYYANLYAASAIVLSAATGLAVAYRHRVSEAAAALRIDGFGFEERVVTAYEGMMKADGSAPSQFFYLQQADAISRLRAGRDRIRIAVCPSAKKLALCIGLLLAAAVLAFLPSAMKERAKELHEIRLESKEKQEEIQEVTEELEELTELAADDLSEEQRAALQEMIKSLQSSSAEYGQASSAKALAAAGQKLDYKYTDMSAQLADMAQSLQNGATASPMTASAMQEMANELQSMSGEQGGAGENSGQGSEGQGGDGQGGDGQSGEAQEGSQNKNDNQGSNDNDPSGNGQNGGQGGQDGSEDGQGNGGAQDGSGDSQGNGSGQSGSGNDPGDGSPSNGRGTGTANSERDYISVPNEVGNDDTLNGQAGQSNTSETFKAQNGLSWEGDHVSYESVIGQYQEKAYEGISGGKYPSGMEDVIKEYFGSFNE